GKLIADGQSYDVVPGTFYMTGPGIFHEQVSDPKDPMIEYGVYLQVLQDGALPDNGLVEKFLATKFWFGEADAALHEIMKRILSELELRPLGYESMLPALLQELILTILRLYQQRELAMAPARGSESKKLPDDMTYLKIEEAFLYNYRDLTLEQLASLVNLGIRQTQRLLQKHYGKNFSQKKTEARMSAACLLLQDLNTSIASVADKLGYSSSEHFTTAFKQFYGTTPTSYRKKL
ncbi:MAG: helix-turn-helix transcriptional regulator, partial [Lachnospiraceae bacterium]|nr:helix-turn-helix transcriptional regulator [Lachnospiraceae bacterium]